MNTNDRRDFLKVGAAAAVDHGPDDHRCLCGRQRRDPGRHRRLRRPRHRRRRRRAASRQGVKIRALGDAFEDRVNGAKRRLESEAKDNDDIKKLGNKVDVAGRVFTGLDAYKKVIDSGVNYVILATPPGFRPRHIEAAINAGKNLFTEKPVGVDGPGIRKVLAAYEEAKKKKLGVARRHPAPPPDRLPGDDEAHPRRRDRRDRRRPLPLEPGHPVEGAAQEGLGRPRVRRCATGTTSPGCAATTSSSSTSTTST